MKVKLQSDTSAQFSGSKLAARFSVFVVATNSHN